MESRTTRSRLILSHAFVLSGSDELLPAGTYDLIIEEERLQGLTFDAYRRTAAHLQLAKNPRFPGRIEMRPVGEDDLRQLVNMGHDVTPTPVIETTADMRPRKESP